MDLDLSKVFDTLNCELLIAKVSAYGFANASLRLIESYLTKRWPRAKKNKRLSKWAELFQGVTQNCTKTSVIYLLLNTSTKVSAQILVKQNLGNLRSRNS